MKMGKRKRKLCIYTQTSSSSSPVCKFAKMENSRREDAAPAARPAGANDSNSLLQRLLRGEVLERPADRLVNPVDAIRNLCKIFFS